MSYRLEGQWQNSLWEKGYKTLSDAIKVWYYSSKTFKAFSTWTRKFQWKLKAHWI